MTLDIPIAWAGPFSSKHVIAEMRHGGSPPDYAGEDYGLYQIYGTHILSGPDALLYVGRTMHQTFAARFQQHRSWISAEEGVQVYLGRMFVPKEHSPDDEWSQWLRDVCIAEGVLI